MSNYKIRHITRYTYAAPVIDCTNQLMLYPIVDERLEVRSHEIKISHNPPVEIFVDYFGNHIGVFSIIPPHLELLIESIAEVVTKPVALPTDEPDSESQWKEIEKLKQQILYMDLLRQESFSASAEVKKALDAITGEASPLRVAQILSSYIYNEFTYKKGITNVETRVDEVWELKAGVCQDFAHMLIVFLRMCGIPSRYVSGYICPKDKEMRGEGATHAWAEAWIPGYGWLGLDPTNNCLVNDQHVRLAVGRNFSDCTPVKGTYKGSGEHTLEVSVEITNGIAKKKEKAIPQFTYEAKNPGEPVNSYRFHLEMQQKQQQQ